MTTLTLKNLDDEINKQLQINALKHHCSVEEEVYRILKQALVTQDEQKNFGTKLHQQIKSLIEDSEELQLPKRSQPRLIGLAKGEFQVPASFFEALDDDLLDTFEGKTNFLNQLKG